MKKIRWLFSICFVAIFVCCMGVGVDVGAEEAEINVEDFSWEYNDFWGITGDNTISITGYTGASETVIIPSEIAGKKVSNIDSCAFIECETIKHLIVQEGITKINHNAFSLCKNLETVILPEGLNYIDVGAFGGCDSLVNVNIPDTVNIIESDAFLGCLKLSSIKLPNGLKAIKSSVFANCKSLQTIEIPDSVDRIESCAFAGCDNLNFVEIPNGVTKIYDGAFIGCESLTKIMIPNSVKWIQKDVFKHCIEVEGGFAITDKVLENLVIYADPNSYARTYTNNIGLKFSCLNNHDWDNGTITVEPTIKTKGEVIYICTACGIYKTETIPIAVTPKKGETISALNSQDVYKVTKSGTKNGTVEFTGSKSFNSSITVPNTVKIAGITYKVTSIAKNAFKNNKDIKKIIINGNITKINTGAFRGCTNLKIIKIKSKNLKSVGKNAFKGISPKARIKVPSGSLEAYKKLLAKKGQKSSVKITK